MTFVQEYTRGEKNFGVHTLRFVVSDTFEDLFKETYEPGDGLAVDIFQTTNWTQRLEGDDGTQGVDDLPYTLDYTACKSENEKNCYFFVMEAQNIQKNRYCAFLFDPTYTAGVVDESCVWFIGKIFDKFSGTDLKWSGAQYSKLITPIRVVKGNSYSFGIAIFDKIKLFGKKSENQITLPDGSTTTPLMHEDRIDIDTEVAYTFAYRLSYGTDAVDSRKYAHFQPLGNLFDVLKLLFDKAEDIIELLTNTSFSIALQESSLGMQTAYVYYLLRSGYPYDYTIRDIKVYDVKRTLLKLSQTQAGTDVETGLTFSTIFIHRRLVDPYWHVDLGDIMDSPDAVDAQMAFINYDNLTTLLHEIARGLNCYLTVKTSITGEIQITFISKNAVVEEDMVYLADQTGATINTGSVLSNSPNEYFSLANVFAVDGDDEIQNEPGTSNLLPTERYMAETELRKVKQEINNIKSKRLLFSTSWTRRIVGKADGWKLTIPQNIIGFQNKWNTYSPTEHYTSLDYAGERLTSAIFIKTKPMAGAQITRLGANQDIWRPAAKIFVNYDGEDVEFDTLDDYINQDARTSAQYYQNTREIKIPYWSAFSKNADGSTPHWSNLKIGSKIALNETIRYYDGNSFIEYLAPTDNIFTVVEISRNTNYPETRIKLLNISKFAYGVWSGSVNSLTALSYPCSNYLNIDFLADGIKIKKYDIAAGNTIEEGEVVMVQSDGTVVKAISHSSYRGLVKGIALETGDGDDDDTKNIAVQLKGRVYIEDWDFTDYVGKQLFARTNAVATNVTTELLYEPTSDEDLIIYLGKIDSVNSVILDIHEYKLEEKLWQKSH